EARRLRNLEQGMPGWAKAVSVVSRAEADTFDAFAGAGSALVATNGVDLDYFRPLRDPANQVCAFVGALDYLPNVDAAGWFAREVQNKVLEALAMGKPVVATPAALAALRTEPSRHLLAASTPAEWVDAVGGLFADPRRRRELGAAGRRFVEEHHHWERCLAPL